MRPDGVHRQLKKLPFALPFPLPFAPPLPFALPLALRRIKKRYPALVQVKLIDYRSILLRCHNDWKFRCAVEKPIAGKSGKTRVVGSGKHFRFTFQLRQQQKSLFTRLIN
jgi:hypothetical protein